MKKLTVICVIALVVDFATGIWFAERRDTVKQLVSMAALGGVAIVMLVSFVLGLERYRREKFRAFIPLLICLVGLPISLIGSAVLGGRIKDARFQRNLTRYTTVVHLVEKGDLRPDASGCKIQLPDAYEDLAWATFAWTNRDGQVVEFLTEGGFPVQHSGYVYLANGQIETETNLTRDWSWHRINTNWFYITD